MRCVVVDDYLTSSEVLAASRCWPGPDWPGWVRYDGPQEGKRASDLSTPLPPYLCSLLARLARLDLGALVGLEGTAADLGLHGAGLHEVAPGGRVGPHEDAGMHPRLGLARAWSAALYVHPSWCPSWGGALALRGESPRVIDPLPGRLVVFACAGLEHEVTPVRRGTPASRRSLALFGYGAPAPRGAAVRAQFAARAA